MNTGIWKRWCLLALLLASAPSQAALELPLLFSDGMVLQRERPMHVWGSATPGKTVRVQFDGHSAKAVAAASGRWDVELPAHAAGGPFRLVVEGDGRSLVYKDVLVGDVWLCSGQSNMEFAVDGARDARTAIAAANDPWIRHFKVPKSWAMAPEDQLAGGNWVAASPQTVGNFTAVGYFFAQDLRARLHVPIGLINSTWGGSPIQTWVDGSTQKVDATQLQATMQERAAEGQRMIDHTRALIARWPASEHGIVDGKPVWAAPDLNDSDWVELPVGRYWEESGYGGMDGFAWYRTSFDLTAAEAAQGVTLGVGTIDDSDQTWVNGKPVGETRLAWYKPRQYRVGPEALHPGRNVVAIRVEDVYGMGGMYGDAALRFVQTADGVKHPLPGQWKFRTDEVTLRLDDDHNQYPTLLYNKMIHPLLPYPIKGVIWYQGEANALRDSAYPYRDQFAALIGSWRRLWGEGDMPFLWVQLASFGSGGDTPDFSPWATLRDSQSAALALPNTAQVVTIDVGDAGNIHPTDKQDVGHRLALAARRVVYGEKSLVYSGPTYSSVRFAGAKAVISFANRGAGLAVRDGGTAVQGFTIAGADRRFVPAHAEIEGDTVSVWSEAVTQPVAVGYAWSDAPVAANLINRDGLPAAPFRSDGDWLACTAPGAAAAGHCTTPPQAPSVAKASSASQPAVQPAATHQ
jgi:sialate O-acetylesterase